MSGYNLAALAWRAGGVSPLIKPSTNGANTWHQTIRGLRPPLATQPRPLLVGSEGTLAVVAEAELALVPRPKHRGLLVPQFASLAAALDALAACLELGPSAVELMDRMLIDLARNQRSLKDTMAAVRGRPEALLMVEFSSDDAADVSYRVHELAAPPRRHRRADGERAGARRGDARPAVGAAQRRGAAALRHGRRRASRSRSARTPRSPRSGCRSSPRGSAKSSTATAPTARSTATRASAACTSARC